ncbi:Uncharacterised protein [Mycobacteroides abscessus]|nr:Uncharacterised protein [Mycobacteroides abscessus]
MPTFACTVAPGAKVSHAPAPLPSADGSPGETVEPCHVPNACASWSSSIAKYVVWVLFLPQNPPLVTEPVTVRASSTSTVALRTLASEPAALTITCDAAPPSG